MKLKNVAALLTLISIVFFSCSKDQKYVKWLGEGTWSQTSNTVNGVEHDPGGTLTLSNTYKECQLKEGECEGSQEFLLVSEFGDEFSGGSTFLYRIHEKGTKITFTVLTLTGDGVTQDCTVDCSSTWDILEMEKDRHVITAIDDDGDTWVRVFEKI